MDGRLFLGTSGFAYQEWKGPFYPPRLRNREMLRYYAERLSSVEINYTFRRRPNEDTIARWRDATPDSFSFSVKAHQLITHRLRLTGTHEPMSGFLDTLRPLGPRLGVILFQCPPRLRFQRATIEVFLDSLPASFRYAFEFRHPSWHEARGIIQQRGLAWCVAETDATPGDTDGLEGGAFAYLRLRRTSYTDEDLGRWAERISAARGVGRDVYCYFKHEEKAAGPAFAQRLGAILGTNAAPS